MSQPQKRLLRFRQVSAKVGLGHTAIYDRIKAGEFPQPVAISSRCSAWFEHEIDEWLAALPRGVGPRPGTPAA